MATIANPALQRVVQQSLETLPSASPSPAPSSYVSTFSSSPSSPSSSRASTPGGTRLLWTATMEETLVMALVEQVELGKRADNGYKKEARGAVKAAVQVQA
ncbi:hypothetical protein EK21DRAFT_117222 [Setomelanomma holmii]|uniref:Uncharacterized protein n=1 Tax=Setomelanomma holmii TaxID=210430 RepID=A0A9P4H1K8_9PLEO|nr:hypothetical protein EK21DRAFT_117222 [Setomelanomma holmii]